MSYVLTAAGYATGGLIDLAELANSKPDFSGVLQPVTIDIRIANVKAIILSVALPRVMLNVLVICCSRIARSDRRIRLLF